MNPFQEAITFASTANLAYRRGFMPEDSIAIVPNLGYDPSGQFFHERVSVASLDESRRASHSTC